MIICGEKNGIFLTAEGKQNATFSPDYTQPGKSLLENPCNCLGAIQYKGENILQCTGCSLQKCFCFNYDGSSAVSTSEIHTSRIDFLGIARFQLFLPSLQTGKRRVDQPTNSAKAPKRHRFPCLFRPGLSPFPFQLRVSLFLPLVSVRSCSSDASEEPLRSAPFRSLPAAIGILISSYTSSSSFCGFARLPPFPSTKHFCNQPGFTQQYAAPIDA